MVVRVVVRVVARRWHEGHPLASGSYEDAARVVRGWYEGGTSQRQMKGHPAASLSTPRRESGGGGGAGEREREREREREERRESKRRDDI